jgi:hypothetical protein
MDCIPSGRKEGKALVKKTMSRSNPIEMPGNLIKSMEEFLGNRVIKHVKYLRNNLFVSFSLL